MAGSYKTNVRAIGCCGNCGGQTFKLVIYSCGHDVAHCESCDQAWQTSWKPEHSDAGGNEAVGEGGFESCYMVPASEGSDKPGGVRRVK